MMGRHDEAITQLDRAAEELLQATRPWDEPYYSQCTLFWCYERARVHVASYQPELAEPCASRALQSARWQGWWPTAGLLRTRAWAYRLLGREADAAADVAQLEALARTAGHPLVQRLIVEACGKPGAEGEVY
jgi:hypothetical protein